MTRMQRGLTIVEAIVVILIIAVILAVMTPAMAPSRRPARVMASQSNLRQLAVGNANFAANNNDLIISYDAPGLGDPLDEAPTDGVHQAQLRQAEILRRGTGRFDVDNEIGVDETHLAQNRYLHIPVIETMTGMLPEPVAVNPLDIHHQDFQEVNDREEYGDLPGGDPSTSFGSWTLEQAVNRWTYASSYQSTVSAWSPDEPVAGTSQLPVRPSEDGMSLVVDREHAVAPRSMDDVAFTSSKAFFFEEFDYMVGSGTAAAHFSDPKARVNVQFFDSSVRRITTSEAIPGWDPAAPCVQDRFSTTAYRPIDTRFFPAASESLGPQPYRWTRGGLKGIDVGGDAVDTSAWCD